MPLKPKQNVADTLAPSMFDKITLIENVILVALLWSYVACARPLLLHA